MKISVYMKLGRWVALLSLACSAAAYAADNDTDRAWKEYHALIVAHAKRVCRTVPLCAACVLLDVCPTGLAHRCLP